MITFIAHLQVPPHNAAAFEQMMTRVAAASNEREPGVQYYAFAQSVEQPGTYVVVEVYRDHAAVAAHGETDWVRDSIPEMLSLIEGVPQIVQYVSPGTDPVESQFER